MSYYRAAAAASVRESLLVAVLVSIIFIQPASAYVDPSTGSYMLQLGMGFLFGALFSIKAFFKRISMRSDERQDQK